MLAPLRSIKSWVSRIGSLSPLQKTVLQEQLGALYAPVGHYTQFKQLILSKGEVEILLDIGFGDGASLIALAQRFPDKLILGFEPHLSGVAHALVKIMHLNLKNIIIFQGDALDYLEDSSMIKPQRLHLYFSDPWPKARHHKRRLVQDKFLSLLAQRLKPGALLHIATDWQHYSEHIQECFDRQHSFSLANVKDHPLYEHFDRPITKYEQRGLAKGHKIYEFYALLISESN